MAPREYTIFVLKDDGHVLRTDFLACENDDEAKEQAKQVATKNTITLWEGTRRVARLKPDANGETPRT
jgi:hypothetical protein